MHNQQHRHPRRLRHRRVRLGAAALAIVAAALVLAACGSSSGSGTTTNSASTTKPGGSAPARLASLQACLKKEGINLPSRSSRSGSGGPPSGGFKLPEGVSRTKLQEAIKKCGGSGFLRRGRPGFNSASSRAALSRYASCMRANGVNLPSPNTSGNGPVFDTKGLDTTSTKFENAQKACQSDLKGAFGAGRPPSGGEGGAPSGGEGAAPPGGEGGAPHGSEGTRG